MSWYLAHWHFPTGTEKENKTCDSARCCIINLLKSKFESLRAKERSRPQASWVLGSSSCCPEHDGDNKARSGSWKTLSKLSLRRNSQLLFTEPGNYPFGIMPSCEVVKFCTHSTVGETGSERRLKVFKVPQVTMNSTMSVRQLVHGYMVPHCGPHQGKLAPLSRLSSPDGSRAKCPSQPVGKVPTCSPIHCAHKREKKQNRPMLPFRR